MRAGGAISIAVLACKKEDGEMSVPAVKTFAFLLSVALAGFPAVAFSQDCEEEAANMAQVRDCAFRQLEASLQAEYRRTHALARSHDPEAAALLAKAQRDWRTFAESSCDYVVAARGVDQMANDARLDCRAELAGARIETLEQYRQGLGSVDP